MSKNLEGLDKIELLEIAKKLRIPNASKLTKPQLISKIKKSQTSSKSPSKTKKPVPRIESPLSVRVRLKARESIEGKPGFVHPYSESAMHAIGPEMHPSPGSGELPSTYGVTKIVLMVRDPYWCYSYWDFSAETMNQINKWFKELDGPRAVLRVYDVTDKIFNGSNANSFFDVDIHFDAKNWYLELGRPDRSFLVDIGVLDKNGFFYLIARSNVVRTPRDVPSDVVDEQWMSRDFELLYAVSGGFKVGQSSAELVESVKKGILFRKWLSSGAVSSRS